MFYILSLGFCLYGFGISKINDKKVECGGRDPNGNFLTAQSTGLPLPKSLTVIPKLGDKPARSL